MRDIDDELDSGNVLVIDGTSWCAWNDGLDDKYHPSGIVLLCMCKLGAIGNCSGVKWGDKHRRILKSIKDSTIDKNKFSSEFSYTTIIGKQLPKVRNRFNSKCAPNS